MQPAELATTQSAASHRATRFVRGGKKRQTGSRMTLVETDRDTFTGVMLPLEPNHPF
jgi:hypothetical protein